MPTQTERTTKGSRALRRAMKAYGAQTALSRRTNIPQPRISEYASGKARPTPLHQAALSAALGIAVADWMTATERAHVERLARAMVARVPS